MPPERPAPMTAERWFQILDLTDKNFPRPTLTNAVRVLQHDPTLGPEFLWYDSFLDRILVARHHPPRVWTPEDDYGLAVRMQDDPIRIRTMPDWVVTKAVRMVAKQRERHCLRDWLTTLRWDGTERLALALEDHWGVQPGPLQPCEYVRAVSQNFFLGLVARAFQPACKLDEMVVFEGPQGTRKSTALEVLGGAWHGVAHTRVTEKDFFQDLQGKWLMVIEELDAFSRTQVERIKTVITTRSDTYRGSYDPRASDHPRACTLAGTTNRDDWGHDETGLRRFLPIVIGEINIASLTAARDQLFAEAVVRYRAGAPWWAYPAVPTASVQAARQDFDEWTALVLPWADQQLLTRPYLTVGEILAGPLKLAPGDTDKAAQMRVGRILTLAGWTRTLARIQGYPQRIWRPPPDPPASDGGSGEVADSSA